jgi:hypothetical protein
MDPIDAALASLASLQPGERPNISKTAREFGCDRSLLSKRFRGLAGSRETKYQNQRNLNDQRENSLVKYIDRLCARALPPSKQMIRDFASNICGKEVGKEWVSRFHKRHRIVMTWFRSGRWAQITIVPGQIQPSNIRYILIF